MFEVFYRDVAYIAMVLYTCFKCFRCFRLMLQVLHLDVAKVDLNVTYVAMAIHACFKCIFQIFHLLQTYVTSVSFGCFKGRSRRAYVVMAPMKGGQRPAAAACCYRGRRRGSPCEPLRLADASAVACTSGAGE
jgi:molybdopterin/thiamine biosynthesis adenylyltransferase